MGVWNSYFSGYQIIKKMCKVVGSIFIGNFPVLSSILSNSQTRNEKKTLAEFPQTLSTKEGD